MYENIYQKLASEKNYELLQITNLKSQVKA